MSRRPAPRSAAVVLAAFVVLLAACTVDGTPGDAAGAAVPSPPASVGGPEQGSDEADGPEGVVTLAFAGDVHFEYQVRGLLGQPGIAFGSMRPYMSEPDLMMVNLETSITERGTEEPKELEVPDQRFHFRASPAALDLLDSAGVDLVSIGNNHGADYGQVGLEDTLRAIRNGPIPVLGIGRNQRAAFTPHRVSVRGTDFAFLAADGSPREGRSRVWAAGPATPGIAAARAARPRVLIDAVRAASERDDVVVVYLHWGEEGRACPTPKQRITARALSAAGADVVLGSHAHVLLGSGWMGDTYVNYGLGNFLWYHQRPSETGILRLRVEDGEVVGDTWVPAEHHADGPELVPRPARAAAVADWKRLGGCAGLAPQPPS